MKGIEPLAREIAKLCRQMANNDYLVRHGWFWTYSINFEGEQCRSLVKLGGANSRLPYAPTELPIFQTTELPDVTLARLASHD